MYKSLRMAARFCLVIAILSSGCLAAALYVPTAAVVGGGALRAGMKRTDVVLAKGVTGESLAGKHNLGIHINGVNSMGQSWASFGDGATNPNVFSDMLTKEYLKGGYDARALNEDITETSSKEQFAALEKKGFDLLIIGNMNISSTVNMGSAMLGSTGMNVGVTAFTLKGLEPSSGKILFMLSAEYKSAKGAGQVAEDVSSLYKDILSGKVKSAQ